MQRAHLVLTVALATRHFVPAVNVAAPAAAPATLPADQIFQPADLAMLPAAQFAPAAPSREGLSGSAVAAFVAAAAAAGVLVHARSGARNGSGRHQVVTTQATRTAFDPLQLTTKPRVAMTAMSGSLESMVESMEGVSVEVGGKVWDPAGLATIGSEDTIRFFRHAELKHGRVAMAAMVGYLVHISGMHFPGMLSPTFGISFEKLSAMGPFEAWNTIPLLGQIQILWTIAGLEHASECLNPAGHYTKGGTPGDLKFLKNFWDLPGLTKKLTEEQKAEYRLAELKNGRLAMIGIISVCAATSIPGSVPLLAGAPFIMGPGFALPFGTF
jgi:hypothetical protein